MILARRVEDPFYVPVQRPHDADACMRQDIAALAAPIRQLIAVCQT